MKTRIDNLVLYNGLGAKEEKSSILFDEHGILAVGRDAHQAEAEKEIDGNGLCCMPGWFNCHVHIALDGKPNMQAQIREDDTETAVAYSAYQNCLRSLASGVVSLRDMGTNFNTSIKLRNAINAGRILGPTIYAAGKVICMTGGHGADFGIEVDGADEARKAARAQIKAGADFLKIMATGGGQSRGMKAGRPQLTLEEITAIAQEARNSGISSAAHAQGKEGVINCLKAGVESIEHGVTLDDEQIDLMIKQNTFFCPTLLPPYYVVKKGVEAGIPPYVVDKCALQVDTHFEGFQKAVKAGVRIIAGNDAGTPFNTQTDLANEFRMMVELGMSVRNVITSATLTAAQSVQADQRYGSLEPGKAANLTIIKGDPEADVSAFDDVVMVFKEGNQVYIKENGIDHFAFSL